jgi:hypothetical protein
VTERLSRDLRPRDYWIAPDGAHIAFTTHRGDEAEGSQQPLYYLRVYSPADRKTRTVAMGLRLEYGDDGHAAQSQAEKPTEHQIEGAI